MHKNIFETPDAQLSNENYKAEQSLRTNDQADIKNTDLK